MSFCVASLASNRETGPPEASRPHTRPHVHGAGWPPSPGRKARGPGRPSAEPASLLRLAWWHSHPAPHATGAVWAVNVLSCRSGDGPGQVSVRTRGRQDGIMEAGRKPAASRAPDSFGSGQLRRPSEAQFASSSHHVLRAEV